MAREKLDNKKDSTCLVGFFHFATLRLRDNLLGISGSMYHHTHSCRHICDSFLHLLHTCLCQNLHRFPVKSIQQSLHVFIVRITSHVSTCKRNIIFTWLQIKLVILTESTSFLHCVSGGKNVQFFLSQLSPRYLGLHWHLRQRQTPRSGPKTYKTFLFNNLTTTPNFAKSKGVA